MMKINTDPTVIGLLGLAGSGKSTAANFLRDTYGFHVWGFARPLKELVRDIFKFTDDQVYGLASIKEAVDSRYNESPRHFLKETGDGIRRHLGDKVWVNACINHIFKVHDNPPKDYTGVWVIDDCRYENEVKAITTHPYLDGRVIKINCLNRQSTDDGTHISESGVDLISSTYIAETITSELSQDSLDLKNKVDVVIKSWFDASFLDELTQR